MDVDDDEDLQAALALSLQDPQSFAGYIDTAQDTVSTNLIAVLNAPTDDHAAAHTAGVVAADSTKPVVVVIGAGIAGLAAAAELQKSGIDAIVLEGRDRIGGRIHTVPLHVRQPPDGNIAATGDNKQESLASVADMGAAWVHGASSAHPLCVLATMLGVGFDLTDWDEHCAWADLVNERKMDAGEFGELWEAYETTLKAVRNRRDQLQKQHRKKNTGGGSRGNNEAVSPHTRLPDVSVWDAARTTFLEAVDEGRWSADHLTFCYRFGFGGEHAAIPEDISCMAFEVEYETGFEGPDVLPQGGMIAFANHLKKDLQILLRHPVHKIEYARHSNPHETSSDLRPVRISCRDQDDVERAFLADAVISTLPLGVLKAGSVHFDPPLPAATSDAIEHLGFGIVNKVVLVFEEPFWCQWETLRETCATVHAFVCVGRTDGFNFFLNLACRHPFDGISPGQPTTGGPPALVAFLIGTAAAEIEKLTTADAEARALAVLSDTFHCFGLPRGTPLPPPTHTVVSRWGVDPFSMGSYSSVPPSAAPEMFDSISMPLPAGAPTLFPAGEATHRNHHSNVHGAYITGLEAAKSLVGCLHKRRSQSESSCEITMAVAALCQRLLAQAPAAGARSAQCLLKIFKNMCDHPQESKYRHLKSSNERLQREIFQYSEVVEILKLVGFASEADDLVLPLTAPLEGLQELIAAGVIHASASPIGRDCGKVEWAQLEAHEKNAAVTLGLNQELWDNDEDGPLSDTEWGLLTPLQKRAALTLGIDARKWDSS